MIPVPPAGGVTQLLVKWNKGDKAALDEMLPLVYQELRRIAANHLRRERPLSLVMYADVERAYYFARRYDEAIAVNKNAREMDPSFGIARLVSGAAYEQKGMYEEAISEFQKANSIPGGSAEALGALGHAYAIAGKRNEAFKVLEVLKDMSRHKYVSALDLAIVYAGLDDREHTLEQLEKATENRSGWLINLRVEPRFDNLRLEPRYLALLQRIGLRPTSL